MGTPKDATHNSSSGNDEVAQNSSSSYLDQTPPSIHGSSTLPYNERSWQNTNNADSDEKIQGSLEESFTVEGRQQRMRQALDIFWTEMCADSRKLA